METATAESFSTKQNGSSYCSIKNLQGNFDPEDDFGPETNIDNIDDGLLSQPVSTKKTFTNFEALNNGFGQGTENNSEIGNKGTEIDVVDNRNVLSDESDEDEWNYFKGEENGTNSKTNNHQSSQSAESNSDALQDMDYKLNPDAAEFVPVSPPSTKPTSPSAFVEFNPSIRERLLNDEFVASSPMKGQEKSMENVDVPTLTDFDKEIRRRPSNILPTTLNDSEASFWNDGEICPIKKEESSFAQNMTTNDTCVSTSAVFGDESCVSKNMEDVNFALEEQAKDIELSNHESTDFQNKFVSNGVFDNEDYPSIIEKEVPIASAPFEFENTSDSINKSSELEKIAALEEQELSFRDISGASDPTESFHRNMEEFTGQDMLPTHSTVFVDGQPVFRANTKSPSPVVEFVKEVCHKNDNPFVSYSEPENTTSSEIGVFETKDVSEPTATRQDELDFFNELNNVKEVTSNNAFFDLEKKDEPSPLNSNDEFVVKAMHFDNVSNEPKKDVEIKNESEVTNFRSEPSENLEQMLSSQIMNADEIEEAERSSQDTHISSTSLAENKAEPPCTQYDAETPYIHDCTRIGDKHDSVHPEPTKMKHYADLLPELESSSTMESDKLESELRESEVKYDFHNDTDKFDHTPSNAELEETVASAANGVSGVNAAFSAFTHVQAQKKEEPESKGIVDEKTDLVTPIVPAVAPQIAKEKETSNSSILSAEPAEIAKTLAPAVDAVVTEVKKEVKRSVIKKPAEEKGKEPPKPTKKTATALPKTKPASSSRTTTQSSPKAPPTKSLVSSTRAAVPKSTTTNQTLAATKPTATTKSSVSSSISRTLAPKISSPTKSRLTTTSTTATVKTNGDVSSAKPITAKRITSTTSSLKKSPTEAVPNAKPTVNLSTRTSLAPRPKAALTTAASPEKSKPSSTLTAKRPISAPTKVMNKDSKDVTNKRLFTTKTSPLKTNTTTKTESKFSGSLKPTAVPRTGVRKPSASSTTTTGITATTNQSAISSEHQN